MFFYVYNMLNSAYFFQGTRLYKLKLRYLKNDKLLYKILNDVK